MRKIAVLIVGALIVAAASYVAIADITPVSAEAATTFSAALSCTNIVLVAGAEMTVDGKYATVGPDATTGLMLANGSVTAVGATETNVFGVTFGAAPVVCLTYTEDPGDVQPLYVTTITTSNFICVVTSSKNYAWQAIGNRP